MALFEFFCEHCQASFEQIVTSSTEERERGKCPKCLGNDTKKLISNFSVAGRGDQRESTYFHGCDACHPGHKH